MTDHSAVKVALVGCGAVSRLCYAPALRALQEQGQLSVAALFDIQPGVVEKVFASFPRAAHLRSLDGLANSGAELAIIASPPCFHAEHTTMALVGGLSVLCEKPMATNLAEGETMVQAAERAGRLLAIGLVRRFLPAAQMIHVILRNGLLGEIRSFSCFEGGPFGWPIASLEYFKRETSRGGVLPDLGVHVLDLITWWFGEPSDLAYADDALGGVDVNCRIQLNFSEGFSGEIRLSREWSRPNRYVIEGSKGWLRWEINNADRLHLGISGTPLYLNAALQLGTARSEAPAVFPTSSFERAFVDQIANVCSAVRGRAQLAVPGRDGLSSLRLIEWCYRKRTLLQMPWLDETESATAQGLGLHATR